MDKPRLHHEKLDVYQVSIAFLSLALAVASECPRGHAFLGDQLRRAASSIVLNIAEGCGKRTAADRRRFYDIARGSTHECGAIFDVGEKMGMIGGEVHEEGKTLLVRIAQMLSKLRGGD